MNILSVIDVGNQEIPRIEKSSSRKAIRHECGEPVGFLGSPAQYPSELFRGVYREVNRFAAVLKKLGINKEIAWLSICR